MATKIIAPVPVKIPAAAHSAAGKTAAAVKSKAAGTAVKNTATTKAKAKPVAKKAVVPAVPKPPVTKAVPPAPTTVKLKKPKLVRDSYTMPKDEYAAIDSLKVRAGKLGQAVKKSELIRAGIKALAAMSDIQFKAALSNVPTLKTGRPKDIK
jgi:hypothetical protein